MALKILGRLTFCILLIGLVLAGCSKMPNKIIELGQAYDDTAAIINAGNKLAYVAEKDDKSFIVWDSVEIGKEYDGIGGPGKYWNDCTIKDVNGKLAFVAYKGDQAYVIFDGKKFGPYKPTSGARFAPPICLYAINGKLAFTAYKEGKELVVFDGVEGKQYDDVSSALTEVNGKLAYVAGELISPSSGILKLFIVFDGKEIRDYESAQAPFDINGKLGFIAYNDTGCFIVGDNKIIDSGNKPEYCGYPIKMGNAITYVLTEDNASRIMFFDGVNKKEIDTFTNTDKLIAITEVNNKPAYIIKKSDKFVLFDGQIKTEYDYDLVRDLIKIDNKLAFVARTADIIKENENSNIVTLKNIKEFVVFNGKEGKKYDMISSTAQERHLFSVNNKLAYVAREMNKDFVVLDGIEGKKYDRVFPPIIDINGIPVYHAIKNGKEIIVMGS
ncbi:MAG: hypothetical protein QW666_00285 [Candidatus Woesearchaeota archaeon]